jgi:hypothetical protein
VTTLSDVGLALFGIAAMSRLSRECAPRALIPEVLVKDDRYAVVRPRVEVDELIAMDRLAPWL